MSKTVRCGDANPKGNIAFYYKGGCKKELPIEEAYRCTGCGGWFHRDCIFEHFELEDGHDVARNSLRQIKDSFPDKKIYDLCVKGLKRDRIKKKFLF